MPKLSEVTGQQPKKLKLSQVTSAPAEQPAQPAQQPQADNPLRGFAMGARNLVEGAAGTVDFFTGPVRYAIEKATGEPQMTYGDWVRKGADAVGLPEARTPFERVVADVNRGLGGAALSMGAGSVAGQSSRVGQFLTANPRLQLAGAATGAASAGTTREAGGGTGAQIVAGLVGGLAPAVATAGGAATLRGAIRGGEAGRQQVEGNVTAFRQAGTTPTVGQATESRVLRGIESLLSRLPGSAGVVGRKAEEQQKQIGEGVSRLASLLTGRKDAESAGRAIERGIRGDFVPTTRATENALYDNLDQFIPGITRVPVQNTANAFSAVNAPIPGAPALSPLFQNSRLMGLERAFSSDAAPAAGGLPGTQTPRLPYQAVKQTRTMVGQELDNASLASDVPRSKWKGLYAGLSQDLGEAARAAGPQAERAFTRANAFSRARAGRLEAIDHVLNANGGPEAIFRAATSGTKEGATTLRAVMRSVPEDTRRQVSGTVLQRMGRAVNSQQNDAGDVFSTQTFLTNWNGLSNEAKSVLFGGYGPRFNAAMDRVARVASNLRDGSKVYANPSGSGAAVAQVGGYATIGTTLITSLTTGHAAPFVGALGAMGGTNMAARLMTNPQFVEWLARSTEMPLSAINSQIPVLQQIARDSNDPAVDELARSLQKQGRQ